ncbi:MAG: hypothetical protein ACFFDK_10780 [Promethearchaeota archaeon]
MSNLQNESLKDQLLEDISLAHNLRNYLASLDFESIKNGQTVDRKNYLFLTITSAFKGVISDALLPNISELFIKYAECENKFHSREEIKHKIKIILKSESHNDISKFIIVLKKIQYLIRKVEFNNVQFKVDLCRIERFFLTLIMRSYTDNLVRGHRRLNF